MMIKQNLSLMTLKITLITLILGEAVNKLCDKPEDTEALHEETSVTGQKSSLKISTFNLFKTIAQYLGYFLIHNEDKKRQSCKLSTSFETVRE